MSIQAQQAAIMGRVNTLWRVNSQPRTPVAWPNVQYTPSGAPYIEVFVNRQEAFNAAYSATDKLVRSPGIVTINVRTPINQGDGLALTLADHAAAMFGNVTFSSLTFRAPTIRDVGPEAGWYRVQVDCPFYGSAIMAHN